MLSEVDVTDEKLGGRLLMSSRGVVSVLRQASGCNSSADGVAVAITASS